ncbi:unnamed protein product [Caenorhabditis angaria]|uniref:F-box domain-containing protein n=1 Tax=Caenorhabditis angaria TaxID=860376 RepID=A0A9P1N3X4_9PELO|nr:unnamed protein product [Caenorhabditis angaria]
MLVTDQLLRLFQFMNGKSQMRIAFGSKKSKKHPKFGNLPENVWDKILDFLPPLEVVKVRRVNKMLKTLVEKRKKRILYADFLRSDVFQLLPEGISGDGEFFRHAKNSRLIFHEEKRSVLIIVDTHWSASDAHKMLGAIKYFGEFARTVTLDASLAELCVAAQSTSDIAYWFAYQSASSPRRDASPATWQPRTQLIPTGPLFPRATELAIRASVPQLSRLRRFAVYRSPLTRGIIDAANLCALRVVVATATQPQRGEYGGPAPRRQVIVRSSHKILAPFLRWAQAQRLGHRFSVQFV